MRIRNTVLSLALILVAPTLLRAQAARHETQAQLQKTATITLVAATATAQAAVPAGKIAAHELERENGKLIYSFDVKTAGKSGIDEVNVDAMTGTIVDKSHESPADEAKEAAQGQTFKVAKYDIGGAGGTDYVTAEPGTGRVFVSRSTHVMVIDGPTGKVLGDIETGGGNHGIALSAESGHGFITAGGDSSAVMFDLKTLAVIRRIKVPTGGLDGIMHDDYHDRIILTNHSRPVGTVVVLDAKSGDIVGTVPLDDSGPEGAASDGKGMIYVNLEGKAEIQVVDVKAMKSVAIWSIAPCDGPTGIAMDRKSDRIFSGCGKISTVVDAKSGKVVAQIANSDRVDALGWDQSEKLIYIPGGAPGDVTVVHQDSPDKYTVVATVPTFAGAKTIAVDPVKHMAYLFQPEYGPAPAPAPNTPPPTGRGRAPRGPIVHGWFIAISH